MNNICRMCDGSGKTLQLEPNLVFGTIRQVERNCPRCKGIGSIEIKDDKWERPTKQA